MLTMRALVSRALCRSHGRRTRAVQPRTHRVPVAQALDGGRCDGRVHHALHGRAQAEVHAE